MANDGFGRHRVLTDLRAHRISGELAERAVANAMAGKTEAEMIEAYIERRIPSLNSPGRVDNDRLLAAAYRKLRRAGFGSGPVLAALKQRASRPELLEEPADDEETDL